MPFRKYYSKDVSSIGCRVLTESYVRLDCGQLIIIMKAPGLTADVSLHYHFFLQRKSHPSFMF